MSRSFSSEVFALTEGINCLGQFLFGLQKWERQHQYLRQVSQTVVSEEPRLLNLSFLFFNEHFSSDWLFGSTLPVWSQFYSYYVKDTNRQGFFALSVPQSWWTNTLVWVFSWDMWSHFDGKVMPHIVLIHLQSLWLRLKVKQHRGVWEESRGGVWRVIVRDASCVLLDASHKLCLELHPLTVCLQRGRSPFEGPSLAGDHVCWHAAGRRAQK